jgi:ribosomal protein L37AE/L43A
MANTNTTVSRLEPNPESAGPEQPAEVKRRDSLSSSRTRIARRESGVQCPECGSSMAPESGCWLCHNCGFSYCG